MQVSRDLRALGSAEGYLSLGEVMARFRQRLRSREASAVANMQSVIESASMPIRAQLKALADLIDAAQMNGKQVDDQWLYAEARWQSLITQIDEWRDEIATGGQVAVTAAQSAYVALAEGAAQATTVAAVGPVPAGVQCRTFPWTAISKDRITALVGAMSDGSPLHDYLHEVAGEQAQAVKDALVHGVIRGTGSEQIAQDVEKALGGMSIRAERIARTEPMRAAREASRLAFDANSVENGGVVTGSIWSSAMDARTCGSCWAMQGTVLETGQTVDDHICGRCLAVPQVQSLAEITGDDSLPDNRPTIAGWGPESFAALDPGAQRSILGPGLYELYVAGTPLSAFSTQDSDPRWGTMRRVSTVAEATGKGK